MKLLCDGAMAWLLAVRAQADGQTLPESLLQELIRALETVVVSASTVRSTVEHLLSGKYLSCEQVRHCALV